MVTIADTAIRERKDGTQFIALINIQIMEIRKAQLIQANIKLALEGVSGSGKTMSALLLASGITDWSKMAVIDTENHSADLYAHLGDYNVLQLRKILRIDVPG